MRCAKRYGAPTIRTVLRTRDKKTTVPFTEARSATRTAQDNVFDGAIGAASEATNLRVSSHSAEIQGALCLKALSHLR